MAIIFDYWSKQLNKDFGDEVVKFDVHNWGDKLDEYTSLDLNKSIGVDASFVKIFLKGVI